MCVARTSFYFYCYGCWQVLESAALREAVAGPPINLAAVATAARAGRPQTLETLTARLPELPPEPPATSNPSSRAGAQTAGEASIERESGDRRIGGAAAAAAAPGVPPKELQEPGEAAFADEASLGGAEDPLDGLLAPLPPLPAPPVRAA